VKAAATQQDRDPGGRFAPGNPGGPGRPKRDTEREYLRVLMDACPPARWQRIVDRAVEEAEQGDATARAWLARYLVGAPSTASPSPFDLAVEEAMDALAPGLDPVRHRAELAVQAREREARESKRTSKLDELLGSVLD
jgi:hypothetical protein